MVNLEDFFLRKYFVEIEGPFSWLPSGETLPQKIKNWNQAFLFILFVPVMQVSLARFFFISILWCSQTGYHPQNTVDVIWLQGADESKKF